MVPPNWYAVCTSRRLRRAPVGLTRFGQRLVLWRDANGRAVCMPDRCCHRAAQLSRGRIREGCLECPYHGFRFDGDGDVVKVPALGADRPIPRGLHVPPLPCQEVRGLVWVWYGPAPDALPEIPWDDALDKELDAGSHAATLEDTLDAHFLRLMENSTDLFHVPFVHRRTIPAGEQLQDWHCETDGVHIRAEGRLVDPNAPHRTGMKAQMHIVVPNILLLQFGPQIRFIATATPIDDSQTYLFAKYVQDYVRLPIIGKALTWLLGTFDYRLLQRLEDVPVWRSQQLDDPAVIRGYRLIEGDEGIARYFQIFHRLMREDGAGHGRHDLQSVAGD